jgi:Tol biopolymer transport system component
LVAGTTGLASVSSGGIEGNGASTSPVITPDGRYVAFLSLATNLVANDINRVGDVFVRDLALQTTVLASVGASYSFWPGAPYYSSYLLSPPAITPDGRYVAFATSLHGLAPGMIFFPGDVFVRDLAANQTTWASSNASALVKALIGGETYTASVHPTISDDGTLVTFKSGLGATAVVFQYNVANGTITTVYTNALLYTPSMYVPAPTDDYYGPEATPDGRFIAFVAMEGAANQGTNGSIRLWDSQTGTNVLVSANTNGVYSTGSLSMGPVVTPDGHYVVFLSNAGDLTSNEVSTNGFHVFRRDMIAGVTTLLDGDTNGAGSTDFEGMFPSISTNGQFVAFSGPDGALVPLDINGADDVFLRDVNAGTTQLISQRDTSLSLRACGGLSSEGALSVSADGRWAAFASYANDLVSNDTNGLQDVFVCDRWSGSNFLVSVAQNGGSALGGQSMSPMISTNGRHVIFLSAATNLTADVITNPGVYNIFRRDLQLQTTVLVTVNTNGATSGDKSSSYPVISQDGRYVAFLSPARNLATGATNGGGFWRDIDGGVTVAFLTNNVSPYSLFPPTMSEDGRCVAYPAYPIGIMRVWDHGQLKNIYTNNANFAAISPDGSRLLYQYRGTNFVQDLVHGTNMLAVNGGQRIRNPEAVWSGDGRFVAMVTSAAV